MLKKLIKMGVVMSVLLASMSAFAQNTGKVEYPRYGFWSNWSIGTSVDYMHELAQQSGLKWKMSTNAGMDLFFQHKLNHAFSTRYRFSMPTFWDASVNGERTVYDEAGYKMTRYMTLSVNIVGSFTDMFKGYDPDRRHSFYFLAGAGVSINSRMDAGEMAETRYQDGNLGFWRPYLNAGLGFSYRFTDASSLFLEYALDATDVPNVFTAKFYQWDKMHALVRLGYAYNFGVTAADQAIAAQKSMLTQENFGALNTQVAALEQQVADNNVDTKKLENRIAELEDQLAEALANQNGKVNSAAADSLQNVINQIKADQINYYAMPFSVLYDVNEWQVSEEEMDKVKAVARVLKDNSDVKIQVIGFADYTGSDQYNMKLSEKRANEVKRLLVKKYGIAEDRIAVDFKGKSAPFGDVQYALNRRVSFYRVID